MANRQKKFVECDDNCHEHLRPPPPPPPLPIPLPSTSSDHSFSPYLIFMFCGLAVSISFISYLLFVARYRSRQRNHEDTDETHEDFVNEDLGPVNHHPIWLINTIGLEQSQIESIQLFKYKKDQGLIEGTDCSVCLSLFEDDESLRLLPKCSHAFHVPCIDTWLRSHKNCPLCRAPIIKQTNAQTETVIDINSSELSTREETPGEDSETVDHHVVEVENNGESEKTCRTLDETSSGARANSDLADHHRVQGDGSVAMRRSVSMDDSSASINVHFAMANVRISDEEKHLTSQWLRSKKPNSIPKSGHKLKGPSSSFRICSKAMKSSSLGHSSQKASRITNKCPHHNRSY